MHSKHHIGQRLYPGGMVAVLAVLFAGVAASQISISTIEDLQKIGNDDSYPLNGHYVLSGDIDASAVREWNGGLGFTPIGAWDAPFTGLFDGQGHVISDLVINRPEKFSNGLFGEIAKGGEIRNVGIEGGFIAGMSGGARLGAQSGGTVIHCYSTADVSGNGWVGGLIGISHTGTVSYCYTSGTVTGGKSGTGIGGLIGHCAAEEVFRCYATGAVSGDRHVGGLIGDNRSTVVECYATGLVKGKTHAGGLIGSNGGIVANCYATGSVTGNHGVGGLAGFDMIIMNASYAAGRVTGKQNAGGLTGVMNGQATFWWAKNAPSFWNLDTTGQQTSPNGTGIPADKMMSRDIFESAGWDFETVWGIHEGASYPFLLWQTGDAPLIPRRAHHELYNVEPEEGVRIQVAFNPVEETSHKETQDSIADDTTESIAQEASMEALQEQSEEEGEHAYLVAHADSGQEEHTDSEEQEDLPTDVEMQNDVGCCYGWRINRGPAELLKHLMRDWLLLVAAMAAVTVYGAVNSRS